MKMIYPHIMRKLRIIYLCDIFYFYFFSLLRRQEEQTQSYEDILQTSKSFNNRACVQTLYQRLKKRFEYIQSENNNTTESSNDILHMTLINSFKR
jgi:hypothetical protein